MNLTEALKAKDFPYIITILFAIIGWGIVHLVDEFNKKPIVEYEVSTEKKENATEFTYKISNISDNSNFKNLTFVIKTQTDDDTILKHSVTVPAPMYNHQENNGDRSPSLVVSEANKFAYTVVEFQPDWEVDLKIEKKKSEVPKLRFYTDSSSAVLLVEKSWETCIYKNEEVIIFALILLCILFVVLYYWLIK